MEPSNKNKPEYPLITVAILAAACCFTLPLLLGVGITGVGFFTSPWVGLVGIAILLILFWIMYQKRKK